jgi:5-methylcytosine-specific restriction enzyme subunit McrC
MMAYGQLYKCRRLMLLYPHHQALGDAAMKIAHRIAIEDRDDQLQLSTIIISSNRETSGQLRELCADA